MQLKNSFSRIMTVLNDKRHPLWVFLQQFAVRGLLGVKFLLIARLLNPKEIGLISIALISLTLVEALTEIGIMQAIVQSEKKIKYRSIIWTLQFLRGCGITVFLLLINPLLIKIFHEPSAAHILFLIALVPFIKNMISINYYYELREKNFKDVSLIFCLSSLIDLISSIILVAIFRDPVYAIISIIVSETIKTLLTHIVFGWSIVLDFRFKLIKEVTSYGRWIWGNSISSFFVNQFDKIIASNFLGTSSLGLYQMSQKMTQLLVADISFAAGQYLFPQFSYLYRDKEESRNLNSFYSRIMLLMLMFSFVLSSFVIIYTDPFITLVLGTHWLSMSNIIKFMMISSSLAAIMNVSVVYNRAIGKPKKVAIVSYVQLGVFIFLCLILVRSHGTFGLIFSSIISYIISLFLLNVQFNKKFLYFINAIKNNFLLIVILMVFTFLTILMKNLITINVAFYISLFLFSMQILYLIFTFKKQGERI
ncbi:oligosaccharide flippase family protein [Priestia megaterium]|uniref:oligosaccharide flippase family protein n=1 Tax=Priestia megaterium TaxID=1404 RepID=UPI001E63AA09|nr:oligosaccharide flippase family protein [Priestia megaterium]MCE4089466.1 oligosaccharide flippase family protein [Priestia megaterium]